MSLITKMTTQNNLNKNFLRKISKLRIYKVLQETPTPKWVIFAIDMTIVSMVSLLIFVLPSSAFGVYPATQQSSYCVLIFMYALMNLFTGTYKCIVRFSMPYDLLKVFWCVTFASLGVLAVDLLYALLTKSHIVMIGVLPVVLIGTMIMSLMMSLRIIVKYMFVNLSAVNVKREPVIVFGTAINSLALAMTLKNEVEGQFEPVAFLAVGERHREGKIHGMPVETFEPDKLEDIFARHKTNTLLFMHSQIKQMRSGLAEHFMNAHINLKVINQIDEFDMGDGPNSDSANVSAHVNAVKIEDLLGRPVITTDNAVVKRTLKDNTVLITGAAGSIGSEIVRQVAGFGAKRIVLLDQAETPMHDVQLEMEAMHPDTEIVMYVADVQNRERVANAFRKYKPTYVFHAAAYKHVPMMERNPTEAILTNVMGTKNVADLSLQFGVRKFVMVSTDKAVNPTNIMGASKRIAEIYVQSLYFRTARDRNNDSVPQFITTRFGNVLGSNGSVIPLFRKQIEAGGPVTVTHRNIIRYFMTIQEACSLVLEAGCMGHGGEIFLFDMGEPVKIYDLAWRMIQLAGMKPGQDIEIIETGLRPGEKLYEELLNDKENTITTGNDKIMIAKVREYDFQAIAPHIENMIRLASEGNVHDMVMTMKGLVPEYISNNSEFQRIDEELKHAATPATQEARP